MAAASRGSPPVLLVYPADAAAAAGQVRPWLRREARGNLARYGTPIVVSGVSLARSLDDIGAAISQRMPQVEEQAVTVRRGTDAGRAPADPACPVSQVRSWVAIM